MYRPALVTGTLWALLGVVLGAFGAHKLKEILPSGQLLVFDTAVRYQFYHAFALLISGILYRSFPYRSIFAAVVFFNVGILLFSGSLYLMNFLSIIPASMGMAGVITPIGGLCFIIGWAFLLFGILKKEAA